ncbi:MAG: DUF4230 domain-containing protein [Spirochaetaceae bacterium]|nr:DUF4230 domain-containing protein [Spirochaetaceae bacterium]
MKGKVKNPIEQEILERAKRRRKIGILTKLIIILALVIILSFMLFSGYIYLREKISESRFQAKSAMVSRELVQCAELATVKMNYSDIVTIKKNAFLGMSKSYSIIRFRGVARAGIEDISQIKTKISPDLNTISIEMPTCSLLSNDISGFDLFDESKNIFVSIDTQEVLAEIERARDETGLTLINEGIIKEANNHAKSLLTQVFTAMGFKFVDIKIYDPKDSTLEMLGQNN